MCLPFIIWTLRRTGGTTLTDLLAELGDRPQVLHEPFNWNRTLGAVAQDYLKDHDEALLRARLVDILAAGPVIKHAYEMGQHGFNAILMQCAADAGYRHILLSREDEVARLLSLQLAEQTGHWGAAETRDRYTAVASGAIRLEPFDIEAMRIEFRGGRYVTATIEDSIERLGIDPIRLTFEQLYDDPADGRARVMALCESLRIPITDVASFNDKLNIALCDQGQNSAALYDAVPNIDAVRRALAEEVARAPAQPKRAPMQQCRLPAGDQLILSVDAPFYPNRELYLDDADGRPLLALMCRSEQRLGREVARLVLSRHEADGRWGPSIVTDLPEGHIPAPFELALGWGEARLTAGGRVLLGLDPMRMMGPETVPGRVAVLRTNFDLRRVTVRTGDEVGLQIAHGARLAAMAEGAAPAAEGATLILLARGIDLEAARAEAEGVAHLFAAVEVLDPFADGDTGVDARLGAALARVETAEVMVVSGGWHPGRLGAFAAHHLARPAANRLAVMNGAALLRPGLRWGVLLPARHAGRPTLRAEAGLLLIEPAFAALADWRRPDEPGPVDLVSPLRAAAARLPLILDPGGDTMPQPPRPTRHPLVLSGPMPPSAALVQAGLRHLPVQPGQVLSVRQTLLRLAGEAGVGLADDVILTAAPEAAVPAAVHAVSRHPMAECALTGPAEAPVSLRLSLPMLRALTGRPGLLASLDAEAREVLEAPHPDMGALIAAIAGIMARLGIEVAPLPAEAPPAALPEGEPVWTLPDAVLTDLAERAASPAADGVLDDLRRALASPAALARMAVQWVNAGHVQAIDVASNLDLGAEATAGQGGTGPHIAAVLAVLQATGLSRDPDLMAGLATRLGRRRYFDEVRALIASPLRRATPEARLGLLSADIAASVFQPDDHRFSGADPARLLPEGLPPSAHLAGLGEALTHYLAVRRDWEGVLATVALLGEGQLTNYSYEHWMMARIGLGQTEGTAELIDRGRRDWRLHDWSHRRLAIQLAWRSGDAAGMGDAVADMLRSDPELAPLTARPTSFAMLNGAPGIPADGVACVIVARNEFTRLKWLHQYYRTLGVTQFLLIDNMSTDRTVDYFLRQPDVKIFQTVENYRDSRYGVKWHNEVCARYYRNRWVLTVDADEVLVFDGAEQPGALRSLTARLDAAGDQALLTAMIDMYSEAPLDEMDYRPGDSLIEAFPLFDGDGYWFDRTASFPDTTVSGGLRIRRFWNDRHDPRLPYLSMQKAPLVKWHDGFRYLSSTHEMTPCRVSMETGALLHFKFLPDFHARALEEVERNQHYDGAREYRIYAETLKDPAKRSFRYPGSLRYEGPQTLISAGLIRPRAGNAPDDPGEAARRRA